MAASQDHPRTKESAWGGLESPELRESWERSDAHQETQE